MDIPDSIVRNGLDQAWSSLADLDPAGVCLRSGARFDSQGRIYLISCFGQPVEVSTAGRSITSAATVGSLLTGNLAELFKLSVVWYLVQARDAACSNRLVHPSELPGGDMFGKGTHVLPLDRLASRFGRDTDAFIRTGTRLGGGSLEIGDAAVKLWPFPRVPVVLVLWVEDEEFPARTSLLLDSTAPLHLPVDILWSTAMLSLQLMLLAADRS